MILFTMEDGVNTENILLKMGATNNPNSTRLATLQERKKSIEESLAKCNQELKQICLQEADLTGIIPQEMPLEPGETPPQIRRRVGTTYQLPENLIKNASNKDESITDLELQIQLHTHMAEAALGLANERNISKTLQRKYRADYQQHRGQITTLQEKLNERTQHQRVQEQLHKQKKKPRPAEQVSDDNVSLSTNSDPFNKSDLRHSIRSYKYAVPNDLDDQRYLYANSRKSYKSYIEGSYSRYEENLARGFYALSLDGYKNYMERKENLSNNQIPNYYQQYSQHSPVNVPHYPISRPATLYNYPINQYKHSPPTHSSTLRPPHRQSSPNTNSLKMCYSQPLDYYHNPHQIQPHQQYEHTNSGLGGYWKTMESGVEVWCNSSPVESNWQRDKRFGSLDRRKNKRVQKRGSPSVSNKSATLASVPMHVDHVRTARVKSPQILNKRSQDNRQLVRTQSLGSVGGQTIDSVWHSDDNSSESDNRSINEMGQGVRKQKQKEWKETFLDGPVSPTHSIVSRSQSALPSILSPEEKYILAPPPPPKPPLEIPAESNPSPRIAEANIELFNNNIPKNGTLVQAGQYKPYHEETKPFEMADCYKYSAKFKNSPNKQHTEEARKSVNSNFQKNLNEAFMKSGPNHNFSPGSPRMDSSLNSSFDIANTGVAERFSDEMNAWYKSHNLQTGSSSSKGKSTATLV